MSEPQACLNGRFVPWSQMGVPLDDAGFVWGATISDVCRTFSGRLFRLDEHLERFLCGCRTAAIPLPFPKPELARLAQELADRNRTDQRTDLALVMLATPGRLGHYRGIEEEIRSPTLIMHTFPLPTRRDRQMVASGAVLFTTRFGHIPASALPPGLKHRSRLAWWLANEEARRRDPEAHALPLDERGLLTETSFANLVLVQGSVVQTPRSEGVLAGVSLRVVEELCRPLGLDFQERDLSTVDCRRAQEVMLTGTTFCVAPVRRLDEAEYPVPGPVCRQLAAAWSQWVGLDVWQQICGADALPEVQLSPPTVT